jgi:hypothetical protein
MVGLQSQMSRVQILHQGLDINVRESYISDTILIGCAICRVAIADIILDLSIPDGARRFTAIFSATDVAGFLLL